jgi:hypothetical protein
MVALPINYRPHSSPSTAAAPLNTEVLLNDVSTIVASTGTPATLPSPDGVDQFRVITTNAAAEYGHTSGAVISVNTISGTNTYHGNLYFLLRNEALDANQYFHKDTINPATGAVTPRNRDRFFQEGGSFGGPVRIPHLYNGRDKTFFFVNYDRTATPNSTLVTQTVPTAAQRGRPLQLLGEDLPAWRYKHATIHKQQGWPNRPCGRQDSRPAPSSEHSRHLRCGKQPLHG